jgi:hypothetical protein
VSAKTLPTIKITSEMWKSKSLDNQIEERDENGVQTSDTIVR